MDERAPQHIALTFSFSSMPIKYKPHLACKSPSVQPLPTHKLYQSRSNGRFSYLYATLSPLSSFISFLWEMEREKKKTTKASASRKDRDRETSSRKGRDTNCRPKNGPGRGRGRPVGGCDPGGQLEKGLCAPHVTGPSVARRPPPRPRPGGVLQPAKAKQSEKKNNKR